MHTIMASHAGFCAGVKRAFKMTEEMAGHPGKWYTWGPLVHNQTVVDYFSRQGIRPIEDIDDISEPAGLIIRSHGVAPEIIEEARNRGWQVKDATCPLVKKVHVIVQTLAAEGKVSISSLKRHLFKSARKQNNTDMLKSYYFYL
jgi:small subunit ribosomal protein S1